MFSKKTSSECGQMHKVKTLVQKNPEKTLKLTISTLRFSQTVSSQLMLKFTFKSNNFCSVNHS